MRFMVVQFGLLLACVLLAPLALPGEVACADETPRKEGWREGGKFDEMKEKEIREVVTTVMMVRMSRELELNDEQTVLMVRNFTDLRDTLTRLSEKRDGLTDQLREAIKNDASDDQIKPVLDQVMSIDAEREQARRDAFQKAGANLTVTQQAKLYIFVQDFEGHMRKLIQRAREMDPERLMRWREEGPPGMSDRMMRRGPVPGGGRAPRNLPPQDSGDQRGEKPEAEGSSR